MKKNFMKKIFEEILEYLYRNKNKKVTLSQLNSFFNLKNFDEIVKILVDEEKIKLEGDFVLLAPQGIKDGEDIYEKHEFVEDFLKNIGVPDDVAHKQACEIEHHICQPNLKRDQLDEDILNKDKVENLVSLLTLNNGEKGEVVLIRGGRWLRQRLYDMGLTPGTEVKIIRKAPFGPVEISLRGYHLALGQGIINRVWVKKKS